MGSSVFCMSLLPVSSPLLTFRLGVSPGWLVARGFSLPLFDFGLSCFLFLLFCFVLAGDPRLKVGTFLLTSLPFCPGPLLVLCPLLMLVLRPSVLSSVFFCGDAACCFFLFVAGVAVCFVCSVCGGCAWGVLCFFRPCLLNVCVLRRKVPSQHASPERLLLFVPSSCLVACRRSVR